ncbi:MAG TPA: alpha/beta fold hydrolase [Trebonia sp.]|jgi:3-oxoadipate enol-lactonase|nr:alpha/beta fold hydrolase [Trebonia sp.]
MPEVKVAVTVDGPDDAPVLVLANPIGTNAEIWRHQVPALSRHFRVVRYEHRGHGPAGAQSPAPPGPYTIAELGADVLGLLSARGIERAAFAGVSLGGMVGIWLAANAPERITSLAVICSALVPLPSAQAWRDRVAFVRKRGTGAIAGMAVPRWFTPAFLAGSPDEVECVAGMLRATNPAGYAGCGDAIAGLDLRPLLPSIKAPTLVISGAEDPAAPPCQGASTALGIKDSRLAVMRGASHFAHYQNPGPVTDALLRHFRATT